MLRFLSVLTLQTLSPLESFLPKYIKNVAVRFPHREAVKYHIHVCVCARESGNHRVNWKHRLHDVCFAESAVPMCRGLRSQFGVPKTGTTIRSVFELNSSVGTDFGDQNWSHVWAQNLGGSPVLL